MKLSFVTPVYNEREGIQLFLERMFGVIETNEYDAEVIAIDDGSKDDSYGVLSRYAAREPRLKVIQFERNAGQTAALQAGISAAQGDIIIPIDSDLENDPNDVPKLLEKINQGYDVVSGWRVKRWENELFLRKIPSRIANALISWITRVPLNDYGCTLKAYKSSILKNVVLYGEMHRFIPAYASWQGARVTEVPVSYTPRQFGKSNYGISRTMRVLLDLLVLRFIEKYRDRPIHFFGGVGFLFAFGATVVVVGAILLRLLFGVSLIQTPLPLLAGLMMVMAVNFVLIGVVAELLVRQQFEAGDRVAYRVKERLNF